MSYLCFIRFCVAALVVGVTLGAAVGCAPAGSSTPGDERLRVVATTSIIGDVVGQVGGEAIDLTVLMPPGGDPHSYQPAAADLTAAADANLIFVNGWDLEEGLADDLASIGDTTPIVISNGIEPLTTGNAADPHVWQAPANVMVWVENARAALVAADPANAATYDANAAAYQSTLAQLDADIRRTLSDIPAEQRVLITNHDNLVYFAAAYDFEVAGTVIPSVSTLAEPTAGALAALARTMAERGLCNLVVESGAAEQLAAALEGELDGCASVDVLRLYTDALGPAGSEADSYAGMMRANAATLAEGLGE